MDEARLVHVPVAQLLEDLTLTEAARKLLYQLSPLCQIKKVQALLFHFIFHLLLILGMQGRSHLHHQLKKQRKKQQKLILKHQFQIHDKCYK